MNPLLEQVFALLDTDVGSLVYHLVLAFSVAGALLISLGHSQFGSSERLRRTLVGLVVMIAAQVVLFVISGLAWQGVIDGGVWLPALDRVVMIFNLVLIIWMWAFPDAAPTADAAALLVALLALAAGVMGALSWFEEVPGMPFNGSWQDVTAQAAALVLIAIGALLLLARRPDGWGYGLSMLGLLAAGNILHLLLLPYGDNAPVALRLGQIAAFPFLLLLPQRVASGSTEAVLPPEGALAADQEHLEELARAQQSTLGADPQIWQALLKITAEPDTGRVRRLVVGTLAASLKADICLLLSPPDEQGNFEMECGYDAHNKKYFDPLTIESSGLPMVNASMRLGRTRRLTLHTTSPDLASLARLLGLERTGALLFVPVLSAASQPTAGFLLLSPYSGADWSNDEQAFAGLLARLLVQFLQRSQEMTSMKAEIVQVRQTNRLTQDQLYATLDEQQKLRSQLSVVQENANQDRVQLASMTALVAESVSVQDSLERLRIENETLQREAARLTEQMGKRETPAEAELRMTLEEVAYLNNALAEADRRINFLSEAPPPAPSILKQLSTVVSILQDLRQPLSSIVGYTDVLLGETLGILGKNQRKYLERIRVATERMDHLLDDVLQVATTDVNSRHMDLRTVELAKVVRDAVRTANPDLRQKGVFMRVGLPETAVQMHTDPDALKKVLVSLIANAGLVTPQKQEVTFNARLEATDGNADFVLLQVTDGGPGISLPDLPRVFAPHSGMVIPGVGDNGSELAMVKSLVEILGGRTWVDSEPGKGAVYSVLLPLIARQPGDDVLAGNRG